MLKKIFLLTVMLCVSILPVFSQNESKPDPASQGRKRLSMDLNWRFSLGHAKSYEKDFMNGTGYFSWFAKAGYGDGAAAPNFEDRTWRQVDLPHDWAVELPFSASASHSHG